MSCEGTHVLTVSHSRNHGTVSALENGLAALITTLPHGGKSSGLFVVFLTNQSSWAAQMQRQCSCKTMTFFFFFGGPFASGEAGPGIKTANPLQKKR